MHTKLRNITLYSMILRSYVVLTWMHDKKRISVACDIMEQHKVNIARMT